MSSILTNNSAMVALQTLQSVNSNLAKTQDMISTGKQVSSAKDNAAVFAISKVMESDVSGFKAISDSLSLGESTVAVGRQASETVTDLLTEMKGKIVAAQEENVDRAKIQTDIEALTDQIKSVVGAAQFNGLNLVNGQANDPVQILSSLDRASDGSVLASNIDVAAADLRVGGTLAGNTVASATVTDGNSIGSALTFQGSGPALASNDANADNSDTTEVLAGDVVAVNVGDQVARYVVQVGDTDTEIDAGVTTALSNAGISGVTYAAGEASNGSGGDLEMGISVTRGGLGELGNVNVGTEEGANDALAAVEGLIQTSIDTAAAFGSSQKRIEIQSDFVGKLTDALTSGIGSLVDANMEEASARLQALQVQQQLATQSLSIANQAPQALLSLFRG
jgi:flagellin